MIAVINGFFLLIVWIPLAHFAGVRVFLCVLTPPPSAIIEVLECAANGELCWCLPSLSPTLSRVQHTALLPSLPRASQLTLLLRLSLSFFLPQTHGKCVHSKARTKRGLSVRAAAAVEWRRWRRRRRKGRLSMRAWLCTHIHTYVCIYVCVPHVSWLCSIIYIATGKLPGLGPNPNGKKPVRLFHTKFCSHTPRCILMYICTYICMFLEICACVAAEDLQWIYRFILWNEPGNIHTYIHMYKYIHAYTYVCMFVFMYVYIYVCVCINTHIQCTI